jgi:hypothetical protein
MSRAYQTDQLVWNRFTIEIRYCPAWLSRDVDGFNIAHLEIEAIDPKRTRLPMTQTGYRSHFLQHEEIIAYGGPLAYAKAWLEHEALSKQWLSYVEASRQGELF